MIKEPSYKASALKDFVIKLRKKVKDVQNKQAFLNQHNFTFEAQAATREIEAINKIILEMENDFELGFVWDESLD